MRNSSRSKGPGARLEYDVDYTTAVRGKYYRRLLSEGANVVVLEPDVAAVFRTSAAVNEALRSLLELSASMRRLTGMSRTRARAPRSQKKPVSNTRRR